MKAPTSRSSSAAACRKRYRRATRYSPLPTPRQKLVHVHPDAQEIGRNYHPALGIIATIPAFAAALETVQPPNAILWSGAAQEARAEYLAWSEQAPATPGKVQLAEIMFALRRRVPDAIFATGAGNFTLWVNRFLRFRTIEQQLGPTGGSMGFGVPAAIAAKQHFPHRVVVCFSGDGDFLMNGQELATAVQYGANIIVILFDNGLYGTIRMHQEREFPGRPVASALRNPDFAALARAFFAYGETVETTEAFEPAFERALHSNLPALIHVKVDPEAITPTTTLSAMREAALKRRQGALSVMLDASSLAIVLGGAALAGFIQGISGFAFAMIALSVWAWALPPEVAAQLSVFGALCGQLVSFLQVRKGYDLGRIAPLIFGGVFGVPLGVFLLHNIDPVRFRLVIGALLTLYGAYGLTAGGGVVLTHGGRLLDAFIGLIGGVLGGLGACRARSPRCGRNCAAGAATSGARRCRSTISRCMS